MNIPKNDPLRRTIGFKRVYRAITRKTSTLRFQYDGERDLSRADEMKRLIEWNTSKKKFTLLDRILSVRP